MDNQKFGIDDYKHKLKYVGYCGCCQKEWSSIKYMTIHVLWFQFLEDKITEQELKDLTRPLVSGIDC